MLLTMEMLDHLGMSSLMEFPKSQNEVIFGKLTRDRYAFYEKPKPFEKSRCLLVVGLDLLGMPV